MANGTEEPLRITTPSPPLTPLDAHLGEIVRRSATVMWRAVAEVDGELAWEEWRPAFEQAVQQHE